MTRGVQTETSFAVLLMDYRGYGGNPGSPSEEGPVIDALAAAHTLEDLGYPAERTIDFGESLGTGVAEGDLGSPGSVCPGCRASGMLGR